MICHTRRYVLRFIYFLAQTNIFQHNCIVLAGTCQPICRKKGLNVFSTTYIIDPSLAQYSHKFHTFGNFSIWAPLSKNWTPFLTSLFSTSLFSSRDTKLRSYLEMMNDMSLVRLKQILRAHFKEKSGTEMYQELTSLCQGPKESAQDFLIRAMNLRQQVIFASQADDSVVKYEKSLVQSLFLHVVETGMQQESIRAKLRPFLEKPGVTDEELMERVNVAVSAETERQNKMAGVKKGAQVNQVVTNQEPGWASQNDSEDPASKKKSTKS